MRVFMQLVANSDLNQGNVLITNDWKIRLVDFTRAFRTNHELPEAAQLVRIERGLFEGLQRLDRARLETELGEFLSEGEIRALLERRDRIVAHFEAQARQTGEAAVFVTVPPTDAGR
jgi:nitrogen fixation protein